MAEEIGALRAVLALESAAFERGAASAKRSLAAFEDRMRRTGAVVGAAGQQMDRDASRAFQNVSKSANGSRAGFQNLGFQIQDFAVQVGSGTSATQALGQQLPQLLSGFGLVGVAVGTLSAIVIPLVGHFFQAGEKAMSLKDAMGNLNNALEGYNSFIAISATSTKDLGERFGEFAGRVREFSDFMAGVQLGTALDAAGAAIEPLKAALADVVSANQRLIEQEAYLAEQRRLGGDPSFLLMVQESMDLFRAKVTEAGDALGLLPEDALRLAAAIDQVGQGKGLGDIKVEAADALAVMQDIAGTGQELPGPLREAANALAQIAQGAGEADKATMDIHVGIDDAVAAAAALNVAGDVTTGWLAIATNLATGFASELWDAATAAQAAASAQNYLNQLATTGQSSGPDSIRSQNFGGGVFTPRVRGAGLETPRVRGGGGGGGGRSGADKDRLDAEREAARIFEQTRTEAEKYGIELAKLNELQAGGFLTADTYSRALEELGGQTSQLSSEMSQLKDSFGEAFTSLVTGAKSGKEALSDLFSSLASQLANKAFDGLFSGLFGGGGGGFLSALFGGGKVKAFATGGIVSGPTVFPMANGTGLMGEAGPEAIMPLTRVGGKLGVRAQGGGGGAVINIDARGAQVGVAEQIAAAMQRLLPEIDGRAVAAVSRARTRGVAV